MKKSVVIIFIFFSLIYSQSITPHFLDNSVRIYFHENIDISEINKSLTKTGIKEIDDFLNPYGNFLITQWLPKASEKDRVGDIQLSRFYDIKFQWEKRLIPHPPSLSP